MFDTSAARGRKNWIANSQYPICKSLRIHENTSDIFNISIIKYIKDEIIPALVLIFNKSITEGIFPEMLKVAKVIPIFEKGDDFIPGNYRPISLLSVFDKLLEKIICRRLKSFSDKFKIIYKYQFGFRTNHSTSHALTDTTEYICNALDKGHFVFGIYNNLKKAFDILIKKLDHYGIRGVTLNWFRSYLKDRKQVTYINVILAFHKDQSSDHCCFCYT